MPFFYFLCPTAPIITTHCSCCYHENDPPQYSQWEYPSYFPTYTFPIPIAIPIFIQQPPPLFSPPSPPPSPPIPTMPHTALYTALKLVPPSTPSEIKRNYRHLAMKFHPDKTADPAAAEKFKRIAHANDILSSPKRKLIYDKHGEPAAARPHAYTDAGDPLPPPGTAPQADYAEPCTPADTPLPPDAEGYVPAFKDPRGDPYAQSGAMPEIFARLAGVQAQTWRRAAETQGRAEAQDRERGQAGTRRRAAETQVWAEAQDRERGQAGTRRRAAETQVWAEAQARERGRQGSECKCGDPQCERGYSGEYGARDQGRSGGGRGSSAAAYGSGYPRERGAGGGSYGGPSGGGGGSRDGRGDGGYARGRAGSFGGFGSAGGAGSGGGWRR